MTRSNSGRISGAEFGILFLDESCGGGVCGVVGILVKGAMGWPVILVIEGLQLYTLLV